MSSVYGTFIEPGHEEVFYQQAAQQIAPWSSVVAGVALFFAAGWLFAKRKPARNGLAFATTFVLTYAAIDIAILVAAGAVAALAPIVAASMVTKFVAALGGARLAQPGA